MPFRGAFRTGKAMGFIGIVVVGSIHPRLAQGNPETPAVIPKYITLRGDYQ